ncbi:MAG: hypothetical protein AAFQ52_05185 [Chloroflexota bacterium]
MAKSIQQYKRPLVITVCFLAMALSYVFNVPHVEGPDESGHILYTHYILEHGSLPPLLTRETIATLTERTDLWNTHTHHPPLYYALGVTLTAWTSRTDIDAYFLHNRTLFERTHTPANINLWLRPVNTQGDTAIFLYSLRFMSLVFSLLTLWLMYWVAMLITDDPYLSALVMAVPLAMPSFLIASASVGNDSLLILLYTAGLAWAVRFWQTPIISRIDYGAVTLILSSAILAKLTGITLGVVVYGAVLIRAWQNHISWHESVRFVSITACLVALLTSWWFVRLYIETGHPFASTTVLDIWGRAEPLTWTTLLLDLREIWVSLWVSVGYGAYPFQLPTLYYLYASMLTIIGLGASMVLAGKARLLRLGLFGVIVMLVAFLLYVNMSMDTSYGRLLLPALLPFALLLIVGWAGIRRWLPLLMLTPLILVSLWVTFVSVPRLYPPLAPTNDIPRIYQSLDPVLLIETDYALLRDALFVDIYLTADFPADTALSFAVHANDNNERLGYVEQIPAMVDWSTVDSDTGTFYRTEVRVPVARYTDAVLYLDVLDLPTGQVMQSAQVPIPR